MRSYPTNRKNIARVTWPRHLATGVVVAVLAGGAGLAQSNSPVWEWTTASPESQGMSAGKLKKMTEALAARNTSGLLVVRNDKIVCEWYAPGAGANLPHGTASLAKAIVGGVAVAVGITDGRLSLDDPAAKFIPEWQGSPRKSRITLRQLGSHTSGLADAEDRNLPHEQLSGWQGDFWKRLNPPHDPFTIARDITPVLFEPGTRFEYSNPGVGMLVYALTAALRDAPQKDIRALLRERVLRPIGAPDAEWSVGYNQTFVVGSLPLVAAWGGGNFTARAAARLGRLMLRQGDWEGQRLLSAAAVRAATSDAGTPGPCGIGWWSNNDGHCAGLPQDAYWGSGAGHQTLLVVPSLNLIAVRNGQDLGPPPTSRMPIAYANPTFKWLFEPLMAAITDRPAPAQSTGTTIQSLEGNGWLIAADPNNAGRRQAWWEGPQPGAKPARVPGIIQEALPGYHGVAWYWRAFTAPPNPYPGGRCLLRFHAVDYLADVWLNDRPVGGHEGGETPFVLDVTEAVQPGAPNCLAVRVLNPRADPIDGVVLSETPHRNKVPAGISPGSSYNSGGITEPVEVCWAPSVRAEDVYVRPDWKTGRVKVQVTIMNTRETAVPSQVQLVITRALGSESLAALSLPQQLPAGRSRVEGELTVPNHRLWQLDDPCLYHLSTRVHCPVANPAGAADLETHEHLTRFGFRELRVERGYFRLNGKRIFLKSSHTGNHCPIGVVLPPAGAPDLLRKDLLYMKASGFNTVRFIAGLAHPYQLDLCDEIGLMVYEEDLASWLLADSPKLAERFDTNLREMVLRDRNHPSVVIFGLVNEMANGPLVRHAVASLGLLRSLDDSRLVLQQSGRWDGQYHVGSVCNPGRTHWEYMWGVESPDYQGTAKPGPFGGYFEGAGDAHVYPIVPHTPAIEAGIRNLGQNSKPVFLSEYGIGSQMNAIRELRFYEQYGANPDSDEFKFFKQTEEKLAADWKRYGMEGVYAFPEEMLRASQQLHCRQRLLGFNLIRSNPRICGFNLTGLLDHGYTGEGLWTFWREFKPGIMDALQDGWAPLRWCLFAAPMHAYTGRPVKLEAILATEDVLAPGTYPALLRVLGPQGVAWAAKANAIIPKPQEGQDGPLAVPVFSGDVTLSGPAGQYTFAVTLEHGGAPAGGRLAFYLSDPPPAAPVAVTIFRIDVRVQEWLKKRGVRLAPLTESQDGERQVILVGDWQDANVQPNARRDLWQRVARGSVAVFLDPGAFQKGGDPVGWLPLRIKGRLTQFSDWLYHKECVAKRHPFFAGLQSPGIMDWDYYGALITNRFFEGQDTPDETAAAAFAICHSSRPTGYAAGTMLSVHRFRAGKMILNTLNILDNIDKHPAADALLMNLIRYAAQTTTEPPAPLPADFDATLNGLGFGDPGRK